MTGKLILHAFGHALIDALTASDRDIEPRPKPTKALRFVDESGVEVEVLFRSPDDWAAFQREVAAATFPTALVKASEGDLARLNGHGGV